MLEIIKYQLKNRKNTILFLLAVFAGLNLVAWVLNAIKILNGDFLRIANPGFWMPVAIAAQVVTTIVMFFRCSSGHARDLLYRDTNYLWLTVPRRGWQILGGRFIAGAIEFVAYAIPVSLFMAVHAAMTGWSAGSMGGNFFGVLYFIFRQVFVVNIVPFAQVALLGALAFLTTGFILTFAIVASRSFVKNRGAGTAVSIAVFVLVSNWAMRLGVFMSDRFAWYFPVRFNLPGNGFRIDGTDVASAIQVPIASLLLLCALAAALFAAASWLMEKKVEV